MARCFPPPAMQYIQSQSLPSHPTFPARLLPPADVERNLLVNDWWHPSSHLVNRLGGLTKPACREELVGWMHFRAEQRLDFFLNCCWKINHFVHLHLLRPRSFLISSQWGTAPINFACSMLWKGVGLVDWAGRPYGTNLIVSSVLGCIWRRWPLSVKACANFRTADINMLVSNPSE